MDAAETALSAGERERFAAALAVANIPTLIPMLVQMTGDPRWLEEPYRPRRARGMDENDSGGLPLGIQQEIRDAALEAILAWRGGRPLALPAPPRALRLQMLSCSMTETIPEHYDAIIERELPGPNGAAPTRLAAPPGFHALVIGAGMSGMCAAVHLQQAGIAFTIVEKAATLGGVWRDNRYPGAGVDTPGHLYSFSFAPYDWNLHFALREELTQYVGHVADHFGLGPHIRFNTAVESLDYETARQRWCVRVRGADGMASTLTPNIVISAVGIFNPIKFPSIKGLASFGGRLVHTGDWPGDLDLAGQRVAMIGNGASAMQAGPEMQDTVRSLTIFQRSPHWVSPHEHFRERIPAALRFLFREVPLYRVWYRLRLHWAYGDRVHAALQKDPGWEHPERSLNRANDAHRAYFTQYMISELGDRQDLLDQVLPTYPPFGKRLLMDNGWYRMLRNPRVELVSNPISEIRKDRVVTRDGREFAADVLIIATGFDVQRFLTSYEARGRSGRSLRETWNEDDPRAYLGTTLPDFPNFFCLYGPNLQPGHGGSIPLIFEMQMRYVIDLLGKMLAAGAGSVECRPEVHAAFNDRVDEAHANMVWTHPGMATYYRNSQGRIVVNSPFLNSAFLEMTRSANPAEYLLEPRRA